jgi:hypothetical protein
MSTVDFLNGATRSVVFFYTLATLHNWDSKGDGVILTLVLGTFLFILYTALLLISTN